MNPEVNKILDDRLRRWAVYHINGQDPGIGYQHTNMIKRIMKPNPGDEVERLDITDWSAEERLDLGLQLMVMLEPTWGASVMVSALFHRQRVDKQIDEFNRVMRQTVGKWTDRRYDYYNREKNAGRAWLAGFLSIDNFAKDG